MAPLRLAAALALLLPACARAQLTDVKAPKLEKGKKESGVSGRAVDVRSLLGGPQVPGPSAGPAPAAAPNPEDVQEGMIDETLKAVVLAAVREFKGAQRGTAAEFFAKSIPKVPVQGAEPVAMSEAHVAFIGEQIEKMVEQNFIRVVAASGRESSADWRPTVDGGQLKGGVVRISGLASARKGRTSTRDCGEVYDQDNFANSVIHEVAHMFHSVFVIALAAQEAESVPAPRPKFVQKRFWRGSPLGYCRNDEQCRMCGIDTINDRYRWSFKGAHASRGGATEWAAREIAFEMCERDACAAYGRVLAPVFH